MATSTSAFRGRAGGSSSSSGTSSYDPVFGGKPAPLSVNKSMQDAIAAALANFGSLTNLAGQTNDFNQQQILDQMALALPGYENIVGQSSQNIQDNLAGLIPQDVQDAIQNSGAARAVGGGYGGSGMHRNLVARDLGLTSLGLKNTGVQQAQAQASNTRQTATSPMVDLQNMFVTPTQALDVQAGNNTVAAAPDPSQRAAYEKQLFDDYYGLGPGGVGGQQRSTQGSVSSITLPPASSWTGAAGQTKTNWGANTNVGVQSYNPGTPKSGFTRPTMSVPGVAPQPAQQQYSPTTIYSPPGATDYGYGTSATLPQPGAVAATPGVYQPPGAVDFGFGVGASTPGADYGAPQPMEYGPPAPEYGPPAPDFFDQMLQQWEEGNLWL